MTNSDRAGRRLPAITLAVLTAMLAAGSWPAAVLAAAPAAVDDSFVVQKNASAETLDVLDNDTVAPGDAISATTDPTHGTVTLADDGLSVTYEPDAGYTGPDTFDYTVTNDPDGDDTATVTIKVNAPPVAVDDPAAGCFPPDPFGGSFPILEDSATITFAADCDLTGNDTDADGTIVAWDVTGGQGHGTAVWLPNQPGIIGYTPDPNYNTTAGDQPGGTWQSDSLTYQVIDEDGARSGSATLRIWVAPVNDAPTFTPGALTVHGTEDVAYSAAWATAISPGPPNESSQAVHFEVTGDTNPGLFSATPAIASDGTLTFTPVANASGSTSVTVVAKDDGGLESYLLPNLHPADTSAPVTFQIVVDSDNDPPLATDDSATIAEDAPATTIDVLGNDSDPESDVLAITNAGGAALGTLTFTATTLHYKPNANANGSDSFTYTIDDGHGGTASATVNVTITPVNDPPTTVPDTLTVTEVPGTAVPSSVSVLVNDSDVEGDTLTVTGAGGATKGVVTFTPTSVRYKQNAHAFGGDTITYTVSDGHGGSSTGTIAVTITPVNDKPNAVNDGVPTPVNVYLGVGAQAVPVLANDTWLPDAVETLSIVSVTNGGHGTVAITGGGTGLTYRPTGTTGGIDVFTYTISDGHGLTDTASVQVNVVKDTIKPTVSVPVVTPTHVKGRTTTWLSVRWTVTEAQTGLAWEQVQVSINGGAWTSLQLKSSADRIAGVTVHIQRSVRFRVRASDRAGNTSSFVLSRTIRT